MAVLQEFDRTFLVQGPPIEERTVDAHNYQVPANAQTMNSHTRDVNAHSHSGDAHSQNGDVHSQNGDVHSVDAHSMEDFRTPDSTRNPSSEFQVTPQGSVETASYFKFQVQYIKELQIKHDLLVKVSRVCLCMECVHANRYAHPLHVCMQQVCACSRCVHANRVSM